MLNIDALPYISLVFHFLAALFLLVQHYTIRRLQANEQRLRQAAQALAEALSQCQRARPRILLRGHTSKPQLTH